MRVPAAPPPSPREAADALRRAAHADLYLAVACETGVDGAWEAFAAGYRARLEALSMARGVGRAEAESLVSDLVADLALPPPRGGSRTLLGTFDGSGSLFAWLAVILARRRIARAARPAVSLDSAADPVAAAPARAPDPLSAAADAEAAGEFGRAFARAWADLSDRERLLLLLRHRDGVRQVEIAAMLRVGAPRVSRLVHRATRKLRRALGGRLPVGDERTWEALRDVVARHLATTEGVPDPPRIPKDPNAP